MFDYVHSRILTKFKKSLANVHKYNNGISFQKPYFIQGNAKIKFDKSENGECVSVLNQIEIVLKTYLTCDVTIIFRKSC